MWAVFHKIGKVRLELHGKYGLEWTDTDQN